MIQTLFYPSLRFSRISHFCLYSFSLFVDLNTSRSLQNLNSKHLHASHSPVSSGCWGKTCRSVWAASSPSSGLASHGGGSSLKLRALRCGTAVHPRKLRPLGAHFPGGRCNWMPTARSRSWTASGQQALWGWESSMQWRPCWRCWCDPAPVQLAVLRWRPSGTGPIVPVQFGGDPISSPPPPKPDFRFLPTLRSYPEVSKWKERSSEPELSLPFSSSSDIIEISEYRYRLGAGRTIAKDIAETSEPFHTDLKYCL